ncbi:hypothetical protein [Herbidospora sp. NBRC 101105]|uniref:hypothetical protein n=1 Tax=Herbidospora sp. NBRC 101105 TaxID=3032195 RepID=UPI00255474E3|nr:hypothetical protein [Herbidospora sp. NBRC 101105]
MRAALAALQEVDRGLDLGDPRLRSSRCRLMIAFRSGGAAKSARMSGSDNPPAAPGRSVLNLAKGQAGEEIIAWRDDQRRRAACSWPSPFSSPRRR